MKINPQIKSDLKKFLLEKIQKEKEFIHVLSPYKLDNEEKNQIKKSSNNLNWDKAVFQIDDSILAGIIIKKGSKIIDMSLYGKLSNLSHTLYEID